MGWDPDAHFVVPEDVYEHMNLRDKGQELEDEWQRRWEAWRNTYPDMAEDWDRAFAGELKPGWAEALPEFDPAEKDKMATRAAGAVVMEAFKNYAPTMLGGAADLVESTKTNFDGAGVFAQDFAGRNIPIGVREHSPCTAGS
jgi:transketolase